MPFTVEKLPDEPIILCTYHEPFDTTDLPQVFSQVDHLAADLTPPVYRIIDNRGLDLSFGKMVQLMAEETRGIPGSVSDPRIVAVIVTNSQLAKLGAQSVQEQDQYGKQQVVAFHTLEEALAYLREMRAKRDQIA